MSLSKNHRKEQNHEETLFMDENFDSLIRFYLGHALEWNVLPRSEKARTIAL